MCRNKHHQWLHVGKIWDCKYLHIVGSRASRSWSKEYPINPLATRLVDGKGLSGSDQNQPSCTCPTTLSHAKSIIQLFSLLFCNRFLSYHLGQSTCRDHKASMNQSIQMTSSLFNLFSDLISKCFLIYARKANVSLSIIIDSSSTKPCIYPSCQ